MKKKIIDTIIINLGVIIESFYEIRANIEAYHWTIKCILQDQQLHSIFSQTLNKGE